MTPCVWPICMITYAYGINNKTITWGLWTKTSCSSRSMRQLMYRPCQSSLKTFDNCSSIQMPKTIPNQREVKTSSKTLWFSSLQVHQCIVHGAICYHSTSQKLLFVSFSFHTLQDYLLTISQIRFNPTHPQHGLIIHDQELIWQLIC